MTQTTLSRWWPSAYGRMWTKDYHNVIRDENLINTQKHYSHFNHRYWRKSSFLHLIHWAIRFNRLHRIEWTKNNRINTDHCGHGEGGTVSRPRPHGGDSFARELARVEMRPDNPCGQTGLIFQFEGCSTFSRPARARLLHSREDSRFFALRHPSEPNGCNKKKT